MKNNVKIVEKDRERSTMYQHATSLSTLAQSLIPDLHFHEETKNATRCCN